MRETNHFLCAANPLDSMISQSMVSVNLVKYGQYYCLTRKPYKAGLAKSHLPW